MPRIISIARSRPTRSSRLRCCDTSAGKADLAVSVAIWRAHLSVAVDAPPGIAGCALAPGRGISASPPRVLTVPMSVRHGGLGLTLTMVESVFWPRLRWRMRGAWQWPAFAALTLVAALALARLAFQGGGPDAIGPL